MLGNDVDEATFLFSKFAIIDTPRYAGNSFVSSLFLLSRIFFFFQIESNLFFAFPERKNVE